MKRRALLGALAVVALLVLYAVAVGQRAVALVSSGEPVGIAMGVVAFVIPVLAVGLVARELMLARTVDRMATTLDAEGGLVVDDLPRSPGGRIDRGVATERFAEFRSRAERAPDDWRSWFHLAWAYDAAGDRRRAREAMRRAARLYRR
ncbi:tetratricopeptide TPR_2 repeat protein [Beutenbergia cavernae DSM 12333]|uniref:Tetratricopeptide TPR_2 repeat protein n=1 Tax=Beutenbergia cavernae (strain ATCC BAA-8 / DSM 12333 / CCUG 43141 / JCM 11478 / NBRC 16432 / NCIMB 13614 / HKI 0122) TaxID=471853 RepID=C5BWQ5_BEUC1|nr:hypothetical protein [Beutenbergia cavernae]ACQ80721.1 tetratricopeptide TPR_2 repeat protein [Beutenbergia cavernae DSM 12333]